MKKTIKKLSLKSETINRIDLDRVRGGNDDTIWTTIMAGGSSAYHTLGYTCGNSCGCAPRSRDWCV